MTVDLRLGYCLDVLPTLGTVDAVIMDPPYGLNYKTNWDATWQHKVIHGDADTAMRDTVIEKLPGIPMAIFGSWKRSRPAGTRAVLIWDKGPAFGMGDLSIPWKPSWEEIYILGKGWVGKREEGVLRGHMVVSWESKGRVHPNQKPVSLIVELLKKLPDAMTILDPFMGSGSVGVACHRMGKNYIGIESDPAYFAIAQRRIAEAQAQPALFQVSP